MERSHGIRNIAQTHLTLVAYALHKLNRNKRSASSAGAENVLHKFISQLHPSDKCPIELKV